MTTAVHWVHISNCKPAGFCGIPDIAINYKTGLLVPEKDPAALAKVIERLLIDDALRRQLVTNAGQHLRENFSWDKITKKWITLYKSI